MGCGGGRRQFATRGREVWGFHMNLGRFRAGSVDLGVFDGVEVVDVGVAVTVAAEVRSAVV